MPLVVLESPKAFVLDFAPRKLQKFWLRVRGCLESGPTFVA